MEVARPRLMSHFNSFRNGLELLSSLPCADAVELAVARNLWWKDLNLDNLNGASD